MPPLYVETPLAEGAACFKRWLFEAALPLWSTDGVDRVNGGFHEALGLDGRPVDGPRRTRVQSRQTYVFAVAGALGWSGPWRPVLDHGLERLLGRCRRDDGLYRFSTDALGRPLDERATLYEQAFVLLALGAAAEALPERGDLLRAGEALRARIVAWAANPAGGFREVGDAYLANPLMHLFEAALLWSECGRGHPWDALTDGLAELALTRFVDPLDGLAEVYDANWRRRPGSIEPGHQFEWAWLLDRWSRLRDASEGRTAARALYVVGLRGVDGRRGVAVDELAQGAPPAVTAARLWPQTERLRAALSPSLSGVRTDGEGDARRALAGLARYLEHPRTGQWHDRMTVQGGFVPEPSPASSLYHIVGAASALDARIEATPESVASGA